MSYLHRVSPNKTTSSQIKATYKDGKMVDANTKEVLKPGQIDKGHKAGYEERVMRKCAEKVHMSQKDYNKMMQDPRLYQFETSKNNRSHKFESKNYSLQLHNCFEVIRNYQSKHRSRNVKGFEKTEFTRPSKSMASKTISQHTKSANRSINSSRSSALGFNSSGKNGGFSSHNGNIGGRGRSGGHDGIGGHGGTGGHRGSGGHGGTGGHGGSGGHGGTGGHGGSGGHGGR